MKRLFGVEVRRTLLWSASAGLGFLGLWGAIVSRVPTGGGSLFFLISAVIMAPPVHAWWTRRFPSSPYVVVVPLSLVGAVLLLQAREQRADQAARTAGWHSAADQRRARAAGITTPESWAPKREALEEEAARARAAREEAAARARAPREEEAARARAAREEAARQVRAAEEEAIRRKEAACRTTLRCWAEKTIIPASLACRDQIERLPRFAFRWVDKWFEPKFSHYQWLNLPQGTVTYIGDRLEVQNVFGAWVPHVYECDFDVSIKTVLAVRAQPGRL